MSTRGQILADELLANCKRYIRFRETGSPDPPPEALGRARGEGKKVEIYSRDECPFNYCDMEESCKILNRCRHDVSQPALVKSPPPPPAGRAGERAQALEEVAVAAKWALGNIQGCLDGDDLPSLVIRDCLKEALDVLAARTPTP